MLSITDMRMLEELERSWLEPDDDEELDDEELLWLEQMEEYAQEQRNGGSY